jgi:putative FmdB family regulatory protein
MPVYDYACDECGTRFEQRRPISQADDLLPCPECASLMVERLLTVPSFNRGVSAPAAATPTGSASPGKRSHRSGCPCCI